MPYNLLLVDDDKGFREEFKDALYEYTIIEASSGAEALQILKNPNDVDIVILDIRLPDMNGIEILKKIRVLNPQLGVIILTGYYSKEVAIESLRGHADDFIEKPSNENTIKKIVKDVINKKGIIASVSDVDIKGKIEKVKLFLEKNHEKKVSLEDVAKVVCLSPKYLSKIFKEFTGKGFTEYRLSVKLEKAKDFLKQGYTINEIAYKLGYNNPESFERMFKNVFGVSPSKYKAETINNVK